jgi:hypothetical protein
MANGVCLVLEPVAPLGEAYFDILRERVQAGTQGSNKPPHRKT